MIVDDPADEHWRQQLEHGAADGAAVKEVLDTAERMVRDDPSIGAIVCECTNITPYSHEINRRLGVPVFDMVTLVHWFHRALRPQHFVQD